MNTRKEIEYGERPADGRNLELEQAADRLSLFHRVSWKEALGKIASPALRLHRYRNAHNRLLQNALRELDCSRHSDCNT
jgi:hypothetical protein